MCGCGRLMLFVRYTLGSFPFWSIINILTDWELFLDLQEGGEIQLQAACFQVEPGETVASIWQTITGKKRSTVIPSRFCPPNSPGGPTFNTISKAIPQCPNAWRCFWEYQSDTINDIFRLWACLHAKAHANDVLVENEDLWRQHSSSKA